MKKLFLSFIVAASLVACNNDGASTENVQDSVLETIDSTGAARVDSVQDATDSIENKVESTFEKTDSANKVISDTMNKN